MNTAAAAAAAAAAMQHRMYRPNATYAIQEWERLIKTRGSYRNLPDVESPQSVAGAPAGGVAPLVPAAGGGGSRDMPKALEVRDQVLAVPDNSPSSAGSSPGGAPSETCRP